MARSADEIIDGFLDQLTGLPEADRAAVLRRAMDTHGADVVEAVKSRLGGASMPIQPPGGESKSTREDQPAISMTAGEVLPMREIGPYRLVHLLGAGGMGRVYFAQQRRPIERTVAIKLVQPAGLGISDVMARFESERQALALMDHPHIAKVYDVGATPDGVPYIVMEHVPGKPITHFADDERLTIEQRLHLFQQVCEAVQHAHTKAILHRDLKPSNVLGYMQDGKPFAKVIDFGVAKALSGRRLTDQTVATAMGQAIGTYEYMSPEQAEGSTDIDTRSDVYALGVMLYELLSGTRPFEQSTLSVVAHQEICRIIREVSAPRPSTRLRMLEDGVAERVAECRRERPDALRRLLLGELEWIPLKALRKERDRRYASAAALAEDVENYLDGKPLVAGPDSRAYRAAKFLKRHRRPMAVAVAMAVLALAPLGWYLNSLKGYVRDLQAQRDLATAARDSEINAKEVAQDVVKYAYSGTYARTTIGPNKLKAAAKYAEDHFVGQQLVLAGVLKELATISISDEIGFNTDVLINRGQCIENAIAIYTRELGPKAPDTLACYDLLASLYLGDGWFENEKGLSQQVDIPKKIDVLKQCASVFLVAYGGNDPRYVKVQSALSILSKASSSNVSDAPFQNALADGDLSHREAKRLIGDLRQKVDDGFVPRKQLVEWLCKLAAAERTSNRAEARDYLHEAVQQLFVPPNANDHDFVPDAEAGEISCDYGVLLIRMGSVDEGRRIVQDWLSRASKKQAVGGASDLDGTRMRAHAILGYGDLRSGDKTSAAEEFSAGMMLSRQDAFGQRNPNYDLCRVGKSECLLAEGDDDQAVIGLKETINDYLRALSQDPQRTAAGLRALVLLADVESGRGDLKRARQLEEAFYLQFDLFENNIDPESLANVFLLPIEGNVAISPQGQEPSDPIYTSIQSATPGSTITVTGYVAWIDQSLPDVIGIGTSMPPGSYDGSGTRRVAPPTFKVPRVSTGLASDSFTSVPIGQEIDDFHGTPSIIGRPYRVTGSISIDDGFNITPQTPSDFVELPLSFFVDHYTPALQPIGGWRSSGTTTAPAPSAAP